MIPVLIVVAVVVLVAVVFLMLRKPAQPVHVERQSLPRQPAAPGTTGAAGAGAATGAADAGMRKSGGPPAPETEATAATADDPRLIRTESLSEERKQQLLAALRNIPRPPSALQKLVSPDFLARASSSELSDLVLAEPVVAAKVMAAVNSPLYGLRQTVTSVGQAITFLGLNTVRSLCLQHMLSETLATKDVVLRKEFDTLWQTSAIASEMCLQLAKRLQLADAAGMATQLVLSSLGRFAVATLMRSASKDASLAGGMIQRALAEQATLSLSASEIGYLLMQEWSLPETMVTETRGIGRILFTGAPVAEAERATRMALCCLCAGLAERIARGQLTDLFAYDLARDDSEDQRVLRTHLSPALLTQVAEALRSPEMARVLT